MSLGDRYWGRTIEGFSDCNYRDTMMEQNDKLNIIKSKMSWLSAPAVFWAWGQTFSMLCQAKARSKWESAQWVGRPSHCVCARRCNFPGWCWGRPALCRAPGTSPERAGKAPAPRIHSQKTIGPSPRRYSRSWGSPLIGGNYPSLWFLAPPVHP